jgi:putative sigma-54 modulation protein
MQVIIKSRQMPITTQLRQQIERKVRRLSRLVDEDTRVEVTVTEGRTRSASDRYSMQLALSGNIHPIHSEVSAVSATAALDLVIDKVVTQLGRQKDRQTTERRHHTTPVKIQTLSRSGLLTPIEEKEEEQETEVSPAANLVKEERNEEIWSRVMEIRRSPTKPMTDQEAIAQMEKDGSTFYPFFNEESDSINVMYKLDNGGYGILVPVMEK